MKKHIFNKILDNAIHDIYGTQYEFSRIVSTKDRKCHISYISEVINGHRNLKEDEKQLWAGKLGKTVEELWGE